MVIFIFPQDHTFTKNLSQFKFVINKLQINRTDHCYHLIKPFQSIQMYLIICSMAYYCSIHIQITLVLHSVYGDFLVLKLPLIQY